MNDIDKLIKNVLNLNCIKFDKPWAQNHSQVQINKGCKFNKSVYLIKY